MSSDIRTRARVADHWHASERGDSEAEHAIYAADAVLDHPQSGERFRGRVSHESQYFGDAFEAAAWRAPLAEPIPADEVRADG